MKFSARIAAFFIAATSAAQASPQADKQLRYWEQTAINYKVLAERYVNDQNCAATLGDFFGCVEAVGFLFARQSDQFPVEVISSHHPFAQEDLILKMGDLLVVKDSHMISLKTRAVPSLQAVQERKARQKQSDQIWSNVFGKLSSMQISFSNAIQQAVSKLDPKKEPMWAGYAINQFIKNSRDPHSYILPRAQMEDDNESADENFVGIGVMFKNGDSKGIQRVFRNGPAEKAGIKANDEIVSVDGVSIVDMPKVDAVNKILGEVGSTVKIGIRRDGQLITINVVRNTIVIPNVESALVDSDGGRKIGYLKVGGFMGKNTCIEYTESLVRFQVNPAVAGAVIDLRGNGGGRIDIAVCMLDAFLPDGKTIISVQDPDTNLEIGNFPTQDSRIYFNKPLAVLVDSMSASASEIFAGVIQDYKLGYIVGERSFGKGTIQSLRPDIFLGIMKAETTGRFHLPSGRTNQLVGILPDFEAFASPNPTEEEKYAEREEDLYRNVIKTGKTERTVFHKRLERTQKCVAREGKAKTRFAPGEDYMLFVARDVLTCDSKTNGARINFH